MACSCSTNCSVVSDIQGLVLRCSTGQTWHMVPFREVFRLSHSSFELDIPSESARAENLLWKEMLNAIFFYSTLRHKRSRGGDLCWER